MLGPQFRDYVGAKRAIEGVMLDGRGIISGGTTAKHCYWQTVDLIGDAEKYFNSGLARKLVFGSAVFISSPNRAAMTADFMSRLRGHVTAAQRKVGYFWHDAETLVFAYTICPCKLVEKTVRLQ